MAVSGKYLTSVLVVILAVPTLLMLKPVDAQTIPKPSVPEFTLNVTQLEDGPYLAVTIRNQQFSKESITELKLYYNVEIKVHDSTTWRQVGGRSHEDYWDLYTPFTAASNSDYTDITTQDDGYGKVFGKQIDVRVTAVLGYYARPLKETAQVFFNSEYSEPSNIQTIAMPSYSTPYSGAFPTVNPTLLPTISPTLQPMSSSDIALALASVAILVSVVCVAVLLLYVRHLRRVVSKLDNPVIH